MFYKIKNWFISNRPYILTLLGIIFVVYSLHIMRINNFDMISPYWFNVMIVFGAGSIMVFTSMVDLHHMHKLSKVTLITLLGFWFATVLPTSIYILGKEGLAEQKEKSISEGIELKKEKDKKQKYIDSILVANGCKQ